MIDAALELDRLHPFRFRLERLIDRLVDFHQPKAVGNRNALTKKPAEQLIGRNFQRFANDIVERSIDGGFAIRVALHGFIHQRVDRFKATRISSFQRGR